MIIGELTAILGLDNKSFLGSMAKGNASVGLLSNSMKKLAVPALAITGIIGLTKGIASATTAAANLEKSMANVATLVDKPRSEINLLTRAVQDMSTEVLKSSEDLSSGLYQVFSAGITDSSDALNVLRASAIAATAGISDTRTSVDAITSVLNAYNLQASDATHVSDLLFQTVRLGKTTYDQLASSIGTVISVSATAGVKLEDLFSIISTLTKGGVETRRATTAIRSLLLAVIKPSEEATKIAKELGIQFDATAIQTKGLVNFLNELRDATGGNAETIAKLVPNARGLVAVMATLGAQNEELNRITGEFGNIAGSSADAFKKQAETFDAESTRIDLALAKIRERIGQFLIPFELPVLKQFADFLVRLSSIDKVIGLKNVRREMKEINNTINQLNAQKAKKDTFLGGFFIDDKTIAKLDKRIEELKKRYNELQDEGVKLANGVIQANNDISKAVKESTSTVINENKKASDEIKSIWDQTADSVKEAFKDLGIVPKAELEDTVADTLKSFETVSKNLEANGELNIQTATKIRERLFQRLQEVGAAAAESGFIINDEQLRDLEGIFQELGDTAVRTASNVVKDIDEVTGAQRITIEKASLDTSDFISSTAQEALKAFKDIGIGINSDLVSDFGSLADAHVELWENTVKALEDRNLEYKIDWIGRLNENLIGFDEYRRDIESRWRSTIEQLNSYSNTLVAPSLGTGYLSNLPGFAHGTNYVPRTMPAIVHKGEMIVPANQNPYNQDNRSYQNIFNINNPSGDSFSQQQNLQRMIDKNRDMVSI